MSENQLLAILVVAAVAALAIGYAREYFVPRRHGRRLIEALARALSFECSRGTHGNTLVAGQRDGCRVEILVSPIGNAIVTVPLSRSPVAEDVAIYETSSWSYQKHENRALGLTIDTGDPEFDRYFDVSGRDPEVALAVSEHVRRTLVAHRRRGLMLVCGTLMLGSGGAMPFGYVHQRPDTLDGVLEMVTAATALARDLER
jgi:hypothetical protein